jgi:PBSX family phage terminase large subunit
VLLEIPAEKQKEFIRNSNAWINIAEGSVRSGKTVASVLRFLEFVARAGKRSGKIAVVGRTERTITRNILEPAGDFLGKRFRISQGQVRLFGKRVDIIGANDERAVDKIAGATLWGAYADEISRLPKSFWDMLVSRLSLSGAQMFGSTNPDSPFHHLKVDYLENRNIDIYSIHFAIDDNPYLPPEYIQNLKHTYKGLWYRRYIDGEWVAAHGAIFDMFDINKHIIDITPKITKYFVGIDYGTVNPTVFILIGLGEDQRFYVLNEYRWDSQLRGRQKTDDEYARDFIKWSRSFTGTDQMLNIDSVWIDPSATSFALTLNQYGVPKIRQANNDVLEGLRDVSTLIGNDRLLFKRGASEAGVKEMMSYMWDEKAQAKGEDKPLKQNDHFPDALRYVLHSIRHIWKHWRLAA